MGTSESTTGRTLPKDVKLLQPPSEWLFRDTAGNNLLPAWQPQWRARQDALRCYTVVVFGVQLTSRLERCAHYETWRVKGSMFPANTRSLPNTFSTLMLNSP